MSATPAKTNSILFQEAYSDLKKALEQIIGPDSFAKIKADFPPWTIVYQELRERDFDDQTFEMNASLMKSHLLTMILTAKLK